VKPPTDPELINALDAPFTFSRQPNPVPATLRPERRVPLLLLLVAKSHGAGASWRGLQLLNWAIRDQAHAEVLAAIQADRDIPDRPIVRFEPALDRALDLAVGMGFLELKSSHVFRLTESGRELVSRIESSEAYEHERELLEWLPGKVTQKEVDRLLEWREA
jgi:hypothetical protein